MFPAIARKSPGTLYELSECRAINLVRWFLRRHPIFHGDPWVYDSQVKKFRKYFRKNLAAHVLTHILATIIPRDKWMYPCVDTRDRLQCKIHWECQLVYNRMEQILQLLFSEDISDLQINLKKTRVNDYQMIVRRLSTTLTKYPVRAYPNLTILKISGGTAFCDDLVSDIEDLCDHLKSSALNLTHLHLPVVSNIAVKSAANMQNLKELKSDRTKSFNNRGLQYLFHKDSQTHRNLEILHLGVFRHKHFEKEDVAEFLKNMPRLRDFSLLDSDRGIVLLDGSMSFGEKILTYSAFKIAIKETEESSRFHPPDGVFITDLAEMRIVDRQLKPHYILESAPNVTRLHIDWQEGMSLPPFNRFPVNWFSEMLKKPSWAVLAKRLVYLNLTFPAAYSPNNYGLPLEDYTRLFQNLPNLEGLRLVGAGMEGPLPLIPTLKYCSKLVELVLEKTPVHVPDVYDVIDTSYVSYSLKKFCFVGEMSSLLVHDFLTRGIAFYMPELIELEVQPQTVTGYGGLFPCQVKELSRLKKLERLSVPLSIRECIMNMPEVVYVLREFDSLRFLILSWGMWHEHYDISKGKISYLMAWLFNALEAENANIHLQLCYKQHPNLFSSPVTPKMC